MWIISFWGMFVSGMFVFLALFTSQGQVEDYIQQGSLQESAWLLHILAECNVRDAKTIYILCNNLVCVLDAMTEEEVDCRETLLNQEKMTQMYLHIHYAISMT